MDLADLDARTLLLQVNSTEHSTSKGYATGAQDYINFCILHSLPLDPTPTPLSRYIAYSSQFIASGPKYLTGVRHFRGKFTQSLMKTALTHLLNLRFVDQRKFMLMLWKGNFLSDLHTYNLL